MRSGMFRLKDIDPRAPGFALVAVMMAALAFGGGGASFGILNLVVQTVALAAIAFHFGAVAGFWSRLSLFGKLLLVATVSLPLIQAIPLPPALWSALPGRDLVQEAFAATGQENRWFSFSVDPQRSLLAATALIAPLIVLALTACMPASRRGFVFKIVLALAVASLLLGAVQLLSGNSVLSWYPNRDHDELYGFFANHNATGLFFVIALCCLAGLKPEDIGRKIGPLAYYSLAIALVIGTILTQSRSSTALLALPILLFAAINYRAFSRLSRKKKVAGFAGVAVAVAAGVGLLLSNAKLAQTWVRFDDLETSRPAIWEDTFAAIGHFWPLGSGTGSYRDAFEIFESLESLNPLTAGRAHNDYLELALESGVVGIILLLLWFVFIWLLYLRAYRSPAEKDVSRDWIPTACMAAFVVIALQSAIDYPLRNQALLCVAAALLGVLMQRPSSANRRANKQLEVEHSD